LIGLESNAAPDHPPLQDKKVARFPEKWDKKKSGDAVSAATNWHGRV
jgi:hypothetical protein